MGVWDTLPPGWSSTYMEHLIYLWVLLHTWGLIAQRRMNNITSPPQAEPHPWHLPWSPQCGVGVDAWRLILGQLPDGDIVLVPRVPRHRIPGYLTSYTYRVPRISTHVLQRLVQLNVTWERPTDISQITSETRSSAGLVFSARFAYFMRDSKQRNVHRDCHS